MAIGLGIRFFRLECISSDVTCQPIQCTWIHFRLSCSRELIRIFNHSHQTFFANISIEAYEDNAKGIDRTGTKVGDWTELVHDISWLVKGNDKNYTPDITIPAGKSTELKGKFFGKDGAGNPDFSEYEKFRITATYYNEDGSKGEIHSAGFRMKSKKK